MSKQRVLKVLEQQGSHEQIRNEIAYTVHL